MKKEFENLAIFPGSELELIRYFMEDEGVKEKLWLTGSGLLSENLQATSNTISLRQFDTIYRNVFRLAQRPGLGIDFGLALNLSRWGMLSSALLCANTLGQALSIANDYKAILRSRFGMRYELRDKQLLVTLEPQMGMSYPVDEIFGHEVFLGTLKSQISQLLGASFFFPEIKLPYPKPPKTQHYLKVCDGEISFDAPRALLSFPLELMQTRLPMRNRATREKVLLECKGELERVRKAQAGDLVFTVMGMLSQSGPNLPGLEEVANKLSLSPRTLRRKLQQEKTNYRQLCDNHCQQLALSLINVPDLKVNDVAEQCGFNDSVSFHKAFKRWTGETPGQYRKHFGKR